MSMPNKYGGCPLNFHLLNCRDWWQRRKNRVYGVFPLLVFAAIVGPFLDFAPVYDGFLYTHCLLDAVNAPFSLWHFDCSQHPTMLYMALIGIGQKLFFANIHALNGMVLFWGMVGLLAFQRMLRSCLRMDGLPLMAATLVMATCPAAAAAAVNFNPDYGCLVFSMIFLWALFGRREFCTIAAGTILVLSKEQGMIAYVTITACHLLSGGMAAAHWPHAAGPRPSLFRRCAPMLLPGLVILVYYALRYATQQGLMWDGDGRSLTQMLFSIDLADRYFWADLYGMFVVNFTWLLTAASCGGLLWLAWLSFRSEKRGSGRLVFFTLGTILLMTLLLTRPRTYHNPRYYLVLYPLLVLLFCHVVSALFRGRTARTAIFGIVALVNLVALYFTVDPVSRAISGVFWVTNHPLLDMTSLTGECCGRGRDQLAYNLEYTRLFALETMAMQQLAIGPTTIVASSNQDYLVKWPLDRESRQRRIETGPGTFFPRYAVTEFILKWLPEKFYYVYYPNYDNAGDEQLMAPFYKRESWIVVEQGGYGLAVVTMVRRAQDDHAWR